MQHACSLHARIDAGLSGVDGLHAACMKAAYTGLSGVDVGLSGVCSMHAAFKYVKYA